MEEEEGPYTLALNNSAASLSTPICRPRRGRLRAPSDGAISREAGRIMSSRCSCLGDCPHTSTEASLSNIFASLYLPLALFCLPNLLVWTLPPATRSCSARRRPALPRAELHLFLPAAKSRASITQVSSHRRRQASEPLQPETIDQQAAGDGAGLQVPSGVTPRKRRSLFGQVRTAGRRAAFSPQQSAAGVEGGGDRWESGTTGNDRRARRKAGRGLTRSICWSCSRKGQA